MDRKEKNSPHLQLIIDINRFIKLKTLSKEYREFKLDVIGKIDKINRKARFIKKTLHLASEGRRLNRKNILTLQSFFNDIGETFENARDIITICLFDEMECKRLLIEQSKINPLRITPEEERVLKMQFPHYEKKAVQGAA
ncbi:MAG: hypothetical protein FJ115_02035 [Deltaproteobacteria bacterium]|nr:hypothetical protein [Deltaproteobacteria bacterium]MBM4322315.1 hypothetical protein [Deltaproteobacteria bacterium]